MKGRLSSVCRVNNRSYGYISKSGISPLRSKIYGLGTKVTRIGSVSFRVIAFLLALTFAYGCSQISSDFGECNISSISLPLSIKDRSRIRDIENCKDRSLVNSRLSDLAIRSSESNNELDAEFVIVEMISINSELSIEFLEKYKENQVLRESVSMALSYISVDIRPFLIRNQTLYSILDEQKKATIKERIAQIQSMPFKTPTFSEITRAQLSSGEVEFALSIGIKVK